MKSEEYRLIVTECSWRFAKTMPQIPHYYTLRKDATEDANFVKLVTFIRSHGYDQKWGRRWFRYLDLDGWTYWTMGAQVDATILVNRARLDRPEEPIRQNPKPFTETMNWPEKYCLLTKRLVPR